MMSRPLQRSALAVLLGMALLTTGCAAEAAPLPEQSPPSASASNTPTGTTPTPAPSPSATSDAGATPDAKPDDGCPVPSADAPTGTADDPYAIGDEIAAGCFTIVITAVEIDATDAVQVANPGAAPAPGHVFAVVQLMIARTAGGPAEVTGIEVRLADSPTSSVAPDLDLRLEEQAPPTGTLEPGQASGGTLLFDTPGGPATQVLLRLPDGRELRVAP